MDWLLEPSSQEGLQLGINGEAGESPSFFSVGGFPAGLGEPRFLRFQWRGQERRPGEVRPPRETGPPRVAPTQPEDSQESCDSLLLEWRPGLESLRVPRHGSVGRVLPFQRWIQ